MDCRIVPLRECYQRKKSEQSPATLFISMKSEPDRSELFATQYSTHGVRFMNTSFLCVKTDSLEQKYVAGGRREWGEKTQTDGRETGVNQGSLKYLPRNYLLLFLLLIRKLLSFANSENNVGLGN